MSPTGEVRSFTFEGESMEPTLSSGQSFDVQITSGGGFPDRGAVVVVQRGDGQGGESFLAKRVVALPGAAVG